MGMEGYYEQYLFKDNKSKINAVKFIRYIILTLVMIFFFRKNIIGILIGIVMFLITVAYSNKNLVEYEYHLSSREFSVYRIVSESKRSLLAVIDIRYIQDVKRVNQYTDIKNVIFCCEGDEDNCAVLKISAEYRGKKNEYIVAVDDKMLKSIKKINPGKFYFF